VEEARFINTPKGFQRSTVSFQITVNSLQFTVYSWTCGRLRFFTTLRKTGRNNLGGIWYDRFCLVVTYDPVGFLDKDEVTRILAANHGKGQRPYNVRGKLGVRRIKLRNILKTGTEEANLGVDTFQIGGFIDDVLPVERGFL
jgi:hypothetical protein